jgi:hypothetical protein
LIRDKKDVSSMARSLSESASFVGSKIIQRLVRHGKVLYLTTPWMASMIDERWEGKTEVLTYLFHGAESFLRS